MSRLIVITAAYPSKEGRLWESLHSSRRRLGLRSSCASYGDGEPWPGFVKAKIVDAHEALYNLSHVHGGGPTHALFTDCFDSFLLADDDEILRNFRAMNSPVVISGEKNCFPLTHLATAFKLGRQWPAWHYPNSGGWMGEIPALIETLEKLKGYTSSDLPDNDQAYWCQGIADGAITAKIDVDCRIFQTMANSSEDVRVIEGRLYNLTTESCPCVIHFNGRTPGMEETWKQINQA